MAITVYTYNDKVLKNVTTDKWLKKAVDPYNPLGLPGGSNTVTGAAELAQIPSSWGGGLEEED